jgi:hypothetical protein
MPLLFNPFASPTRFGHTSGLYHAFPPGLCIRDTRRLSDRHGRVILTGSFCLTLLDPLPRTGLGLQGKSACALPGSISTRLLVCNIAIFYTQSHLPNSIPPTFVSIPSFSFICLNTSLPTFARFQGEGTRMSQFFWFFCFIAFYLVQSNT